MLKVAQLVTKLQCENAQYTYNNLLNKNYGVFCLTQENDAELEFRYIENIIHIDLLKSGINCPKTHCDAV